MTKRKQFSVLMTFVTLLICVAIVEAQVLNTCPEIVNQALSQVGTLCANVGSNDACYGNHNVTANFIDPSISLDTFDQPGDIVEIDDLHSIETASVDESASTWGIGLMRIQANLPNTLPGQSVLLLATGGQQVENGVLPEEEVTLSAEGVTVTTNAGAATDLRPTYPSSVQIDPVASIPAGTAVTADAMTPDGQWVRVVHQNQFGWIPRASLPQDADLTGLTTVGPGDFTHMQSFYIMAQVGSLECADAPASVIVQGPQDVPVDIEVYDVRIRIESTILLRSNADGQRLELMTLFGLATINPDTPNAIVVPPGFVTSIAYTPEFVNLGTEGDADEKGLLGSWSIPHLLTEREIAGIQFLNRLPANVLNYPFAIPQFVRASGVGGPIPRLIFADDEAVAAVSRACARGSVPVNVCEILLD
jgi:hypothetical protein